MQFNNNLLDRGKKDDISYIKGYYFYEWNIDELVLIAQEQVKHHEFKIKTKELVNEGLKNLVQKNSVVQLSPAGHIFRHPSGTRNKIFIQARELAIDEPELLFIGQSISVIKGNLLKEASVVLIDTMGIYSYVSEAIKSCGGFARIESFHGYDKLETLSPPVDSYLCVISASTSGGMERELIAKGFATEKIITLIDRPPKRSGDVLISLDSISSTYKNILKVGTETEIELVGENFSSKSKPPRPVTLGVVHHPKNLNSILRNFALGGVEVLNFGRGGKSHTKLISLNIEKILKNNPTFDDWLKDEINWSVPSSIDVIVYEDDAASKEVAIKTKDILDSNIGGRQLNKLIPHSQISKEELNNCKGILVISSACGDGTVLRGISRDLRELVPTETPRHYLVAVGLPQNEAAWARLKQFLEKNPTSRNYGFSNWLYLPIGYDGANNAWQEYSSLTQEIQVINQMPHEIDESIAKSSLDLAAKVLSENHNGFLPKFDNSALQLTEGFVYFENQFDEKIEEISASTVYLTMTAVIQRARDIDNPELQLKPTGYESVVIAPECFLRFNDSILQACILRACQPSELDYSASVELSGLMKEFLIKVFSRNDQTFGEAALEYAAALAIQRLRLKEEDLRDLLEVTIKKMKSQPSALLGLLIMIKTN